jgi:hypothetical protein
MQRVCDTVHKKDLLLDLDDIDMTLKMERLNTDDAAGDSPVPS